MPASNQAPFIKTVQAVAPAVATGADDENPVCVVDLGAAAATGVVTGVTYVPKATYTGAVTNNRSFILRNKLQDGTGTTVVAQLDGVNAVNIAAHDEGAITLSGTAANLVVTHGDVLAFRSLHVGTGLADPGGVVTVKYSRD
jgi:hypothetical protein